MERISYSVTTRPSSGTTLSRKFFSSAVVMACSAGLPRSCGGGASEGEQFVHSSGERQRQQVAVRRQRQPAAAAGMPGGWRANNYEAQYSIRARSGVSLCPQCLPAVVLSGDAYKDACRAHLWGNPHIILQRREDKHVRPLLPTMHCCNLALALDLHAEAVSVQVPNEGNAARNALRSVQGDSALQR